MTGYHLPYQYWQRSLMGLPAKLSSAPAEAGFYRKRLRDGSGWHAIAVWPDEDGKLWAKTGKHPPVAVDEAWGERVFAWCSKNTISELAYNAFIETGKWHDDVPEPSAASSNGPPEVIIQETIAEIRAEAEAWLKSIGGEIKTKEHADRAGNYADRFAQLEKEAETARETEKRSHLEEGRAVDDTWRPIKAAGAEARSWARKLLEPYLLAEKARLHAIAADKAAAGEHVSEAETKAKAGTRGRGVRLQAIRKLFVTDLEALRVHYRDDPRLPAIEGFSAILARLATDDIESGKTVPGAEIRTVQEAR